MLLRFLKENDNMHRIARVMVNQVGMMIFATVITMTAASWQEEALRQPMALVASIFSIVFYLFLVFYAMREEGSRDSVKIAGGRLEYKPAYGLKIGLCATAPNYIFVLLMLLGLIIGLKTDAEGALLNVGGGGIWAAGYMVIQLLQSMYSGVLKALFAVAGLETSMVAATVAYLVTPLIAPLAAYAGYVFGCKHPMRVKS